MLIHQNIKMDVDKPPLLTQLRSHLSDLRTTPTESLDTLLLDLCTSQLANIPERFFPLSERQELISWTLETLQTRTFSSSDDSRRLLSLLGALLHSVPLSAVLQLEPSPDLVAGLDVSSPYHDVILTALKSADRTSAERLATTDRAVFEAVVRLWLVTPQLGTAETAMAALVHMLRVGKEAVWKRVFRDKDVIGQCYEICSAESMVDITRMQKSLAQMRLLAFVAEISGMNWRTVAESQLPEVERMYGLEHGKGLLDFVALHMVDYKDDPLLHSNMLSFFTSLLKAHANGLEFLTSRGIHENISSLYLASMVNIDDFEARLQHASAASYVSAYVRHHPQSIAPDTGLGAHLQESFATVLQRSTSQWIKPPDTFGADLDVFVSLPKEFLLKTTTPLHHLIPTKYPTPVALDALSAIFNPNPHPGMCLDIETFPAPSTEASSTALTLATNLYRSYYAQNPNLYKDLVAHSRLITIPATAISSLNLLHTLLSLPSGGLKDILDARPASEEAAKVVLGMFVMEGVRSEPHDVRNARFRIVDKMAELVEREDVKEILGRGGLSVWSSLRHALRQTGLWQRRDRAGRDVEAEVATLAR